MSVRNSSLVRNRLSDFWGACLSLLCLVHCAAPLLIGPLLTIDQLADREFHLVIAGVGIPLSMISLKTSKTKWLLAVLFIVGWGSFLSAGYILGDRAFYLELPGGLMISAAHLVGMVMMKSRSDRRRQP
jgi:MerC mercury resistance protein